MRLKANFKKHILQFKFDAGTSRGIMKVRETWYLIIYNIEAPNVYGTGEAAPLLGLSIEKIEEMDTMLSIVCNYINAGKLRHLDDILLIPEIKLFPSIIFALETALLDLENLGNKIIFKNDFSKGKQGIPINGLIWMGNETFMQEQIANKLKDGFTCIKIKIGALDFATELSLIRMIRKNFSSKEIVIRLDANGAFSLQEAQDKLEQLSLYEIHSIEQPIRAGQRKEMRTLCKNSPIPVALDEELIGLTATEEKISLLEYISPQYIILKPTLLGGLFACDEWISHASNRGIGWWATSALESNIGLNSISQWTAEKDLIMPQGLGTGQLFHNNIESPLIIHEGYLRVDNRKKWKNDLLYDEVL